MENIENLKELKKLNRIKKLVTTLNVYRDVYYNSENPLVSDYEYDTLFDELSSLEKETGFVLSNSPTQSVGYEIKSVLTKVHHNHPMLSLDKTKNPDELMKFFDNKACLIMHKLDGLTISLRYLNGILQSAETRGNGVDGEDITHNARVFKNIPLTIPYDGEFILDGEAIITRDDFEKINSELPDDKKYKNVRNLASGSTRQLDSKIAQTRNLRFVAWKVIKGIDDNSFSVRLETAKTLGFDVVDYSLVPTDVNRKSLDTLIETLKKKANEKQIPIDGLVVSYDDVAYGDSLGATGHHVRSQLAFKFYDEEVETVLRKIDWTMGKTGILTPTAVFDPVVIDDTTVSRASLHNVSILKKLKLKLGDTITVHKSNQIIPQVVENLSAFNRPDGYLYIYIPKSCPVCGGRAFVEESNGSLFLTCKNVDCKGKLLGKLTHFVALDAMNIIGLSESSLQKFIDLGVLSSFEDIYRLHKHRAEIESLDGFGSKSVDKLFAAIEDSKHTTLDRFIVALSIPLIGNTASKEIAKMCDYDFNKFIEMCRDDFDWTCIDKFGEEMNKSLTLYVQAHLSKITSLASLMSFERPSSITSSNILSGKTFVITGSLYSFKNRDDAKQQIENMGGKVAGSVSKNTSYLVNNDITSTSGKNKKALELGIPIITEEQLLKIIESDEK